VLLPERQSRTTASAHHVDHLLREDERALIWQQRDGQSTGRSVGCWRSSTLRPAVVVRTARDQ